jgi:hypothetical protein
MGCSGCSLANDHQGHVGSVRFIAPIRFVRFLVDLLKCEAIYQFLISGDLGRRLLVRTSSNDIPCAIPTEQMRCESFRLSAY